MKNFYILALFFASFWQVNAQYCTPNFPSGCAFGDNIDSFSIPNAGFAHLNTGCSSATYEDYTATQTITLQASVIYSFNVVHGFGGQYVGIWVDFNNDFDFDPTTELIGSGISSGNITTSSLQVPATVAPGSYRMRVVDNWSYAPIPCQVNGFGEAHDYTLVVTAAPNCVAPTNLAASSITSSSAILNWTATTVVPTNGYDIYYTTSTTAPTATTTPTLTGLTGTSTNLSTLSPTSTYRVYIRSACTSTDNSAWSVPVIFTTPCAPIVPDYTNYFLTFPGDCWAQKSGGDATTGPTGTDSNWYSDDFLNGSTNPSARINLFYQDITGWLISPTFNLAAGGYRVTFDYGLTEYSGPNSAVMGNDDLVQLLMSDNGGTTWTILNTWDASSNVSNNSNFYSFDLVGLGGPNTKFALYATSGTTDDNEDYNFYVDNFTVEIIPTCIKPTDVVVSALTVSGATVSWTAPASAPANGYQVYYSTASTPPTASTVPSITGITTTSTILTGLNSSSVYYVWVRSNCSTADQSSWTMVTSFVTVCATTNVPYTQDFSTATVPGMPLCTSVSNDGNGNIWATANSAFDFTGKVLRYGYNFNNPGNTWFYTPGINLTAGTTYYIGYKFGGTGFVEKLKVAVGTANNAAAMTTTINDHPSITGSAVTTIVDQTYTPTVSGVYYFGFQAYSDADQNALYLDDIKISNVSLSTNETSVKENSLTIYPNPFTDFIRISDVKDVVSISIVDLSGRLVKTVKPAREINLGDLKTGMYLINLKMKDGSVQTVKAIKK